MAYLAFYRTFRPETFSEVVRQEHIIRILKNQIAADRVGHAYLFCGPRGTGKTTVARIFARAINCLSPVDGSPCGKCASCKALKEASSFDILEIDAASNNGVDEMRDLREKVQYPPVATKYKVYIIDEVHMLTDSAFNALLKTLEEPPSHAVFIMATTEPHKLPATILSRCMRFNFKLLPEEDLRDHLKGILNKIGKEYEEEAVAAIAAAGAGSDRDMLSLADTCVSYSTGKLTYEDVTKVLGSADFFETGKLCESILVGDSGKALSLLEGILKEGKSVGVLVKDILTFLNDCAIGKLCADAEKILSLSQKMAQYVKTVGERTNGHRLLRATEVFTRAENEMKYSSAPRIVLETAAVKASMPETDYDVEAILSRLSALEEGVKNAPPSTVKERAESKQAKPSLEISPVEEEEIPFAEEPVPVWEQPVKEEPVKEPPLQARAFEKIEPEREESPFSSFASEKEERKEPSFSPKSVSSDVKENTFGKFLRALRSEKAGPALIVMCRDLSSFFEGDTFVLGTEKDFIYGNLTREGHTQIIQKALESIGVTEYEIRLLKGKEEEKVSLTERVKKDFPDVPIEER